MLPYNKYPQRLLMEIIYTIVQMINAIPRKGSISYRKLSIREILTGKKLIIPPVAVGLYVHAIPSGLSNPGYNSADKKRSFEVLYLRLNQGGGHSVLTLITKQVSNVGQVEKTPMPQSAIDLVENMADKEGVPNGIIFGDSNNYQVLDDFKLPDNNELDLENDNNAASDALYNTKDSKELPSDPKLLWIYEDVDNSELESLSGLVEQPEGEVDNGEPGVNDDEQEDHEDVGETGVVSNLETDDNKLRNDPEIEPEPRGSEVDESSDNKEEELTDDTKENLDQNPNSNNLENKNANQIRHPRIIKRIEDQFDGNYWAMVTVTVSEFNKIEASVATPQYGFNKGLKLFGKVDYKATVKELSENLLDRGTVEMVRNPTKRIHKLLMLYLMFIKRKRTGIIKLQGLCNRRLQHEYITKDNESSLPTVATNALFAVCVLIAAQGRQTAIVDIPGAFLQSDYPKDKEGYICFTGIMVDMIVKIKPENREFVVKTKSGSKYLIGKLFKGVYGTLLGAILFYTKMKNYLEKLCFKMNPYNLCTFNKMINGQQCTIQFHVDNLLISHMESEVLGQIIELLNLEFGRIKRLEADY